MAIDQAWHSFTEVTTCTVACVEVSIFFASQKSIHRGEGVGHACRHEVLPLFARNDGKAADTAADAAAARACGEWKWEGESQVGWGPSAMNNGVRSGGEKERGRPRGPAAVFFK